MARRRMISEELIADEEFNALSIEGQNLFLRMLAIADDCGVVPGNIYTLVTLTNPPPQVRKKIEVVLQEIVSAGLGRMIEHDGKPWFAFKGNSFLLHQGHILNHRKRSECLKITAEEYDSGSFPDFPGFSSTLCNERSSVVVSSKQQVESRKKKETAFVVPKVEDVIAYVTEHGFSEGLARKAFEHYDVADWHDAKGNKVKNWKQKMISVWMTDKNRETGKPKIPPISGKKPQWADG